MATKTEAWPETAWRDHPGGAAVEMNGDGDGMPRHGRGGRRLPQPDLPGDLTEELHRAGVRWKEAPADEEGRRPDMTARRSPPGLPLEARIRGRKDADYNPSYQEAQIDHQLPALHKAVMCPARYF